MASLPASAGVSGNGQLYWLKGHHARKSNLARRFVNQKIMRNSEFFSSIVGKAVRKGLQIAAAFNRRNGLLRPIQSRGMIINIAFR